MFAGCAFGLVIAAALLGMLCAAAAQLDPAFRPAGRQQSLLSFQHSWLENLHWLQRLNTQQSHSHRHMFPRAAVPAPRGRSTSPLPLQLPPDGTGRTALQSLLHTCCPHLAHWLLPAVVARPADALDSHALVGACSGRKGACARSRSSSRGPFSSCGGPPARAKPAAQRACRSAGCRALPSRGHEELHFSWRLGRQGRAQGVLRTWCLSGLVSKPCIKLGVDARSVRL